MVPVIPTELLRRVKLSMHLTQFRPNTLRDKEKLSLNWSWPEMSKNYKIGFFRYVNNKLKQKENIIPQERWISHQQFWKGRGSQYFLHLCLYQYCWAPGLGNKNPGQCKHRPTITEGRAGMWTNTGAWPLQTNVTWQYSPEGVKRAGWCCCEATLHNLWEVVETRGSSRRLEEGRCNPHLQ